MHRWNYRQKNSDRRREQLPIPQALDEISTSTSRPYPFEANVWQTRGVVLFADIIASTEIYDRIGDLKAFTLLSRYLVEVHAVLQKHNGRLVKTLGDAVMVYFRDPINALRCAKELVEWSGRPELSEANTGLRIGLAYGPLLRRQTARNEDYFGQTVNLAARLVGRAQCGEIVIGPCHRFSDEALAQLNDHFLVPAVEELKGFQEPVAFFKTKRIMGRE